MTLNEPVFGLNDFNAPKMMTENDVLVNTILMICFGKPGCYPSIPELGLNIQRYFYGIQEDIDVAEIKASLAIQCSLLADQISDGTIDVQKTLTSDGKIALLITTPTIERVSNNILVIGISTDKSGTVVYNYELMQSIA